MDTDESFFTSQIHLLAATATANVRVGGILVPKPGGVHVFVNVDDFAGFVFLKFQFH